MTNVISELRNTTESSKLYKLRKFLASDYFCALVVLYSVAVICFNWIIPGAFVLALITGFVFFFSDDIVSVFLPIMLSSRPSASRRTTPSGTTWLLRPSVCSRSSPSCSTTSSIGNGTSRR